VLTVPFASVTTRPPKLKDKKGDAKLAALADPSTTNAPKSGTNTVAAQSGSASAPANALISGTNAPAADGTNVAKSDKKSKDAVKQVEVVFLMEDDHAKMVPVKIGISDDTHWEITEGVTEGQEVVSGGFKAITRELEDGTKIRKGPAPGDKERASEKKE
jgi:HlyD family secretion protein